MFANLMNPTVTKNKFYVHIFRSYTDFPACLALLSVARFIGYTADRQRR
jgi:hypothetical protein